MNDLFFGASAVWFTVPAVIGTVFFSLRLGLMLVGGDDGGMDADADVHVDVDGHDGDSTEAFRVLSLQAIAAFMMGFGWGGLGGLRGLGWTPFSSAAFGVTSGVLMVWLLGKMLLAMKRLESSGNISIEQALEMEGSVYTAIPGQSTGQGRVRLVIDDRERFFKAITEGEEIGSRERVRVIGLGDDNSVIVTKT